MKKYYSSLDVKKNFILRGLLHLALIMIFILFASIIIFSFITNFSYDFLNNIFERLIYVIAFILCILIFHIKDKQVIKISINDTKGTIKVHYINIFGTRKKYLLNARDLSIGCNPSNPIKSSGKFVLTIQNSKRSSKSFKIIENETGWIKETFEELVIELMFLKNKNPAFSDVKMYFLYNQKKYFENKFSEIENAL